MSNSTTAEAVARGGTVAARSSVWDSVRVCGIFSGMGIDKQELRRRILMPEYLRSAMVAAIRTQDADGAAEAALQAGTDELPEAPVVVFVNSRSGGRHGPQLKLRLQELISEEQVFDLSVTQPSQFVRYGLTCLENLAARGDNCAKAVRENLRIMVAGGDGTVGWVLGSLGELFLKEREPVPPTGIIPLGTGNDLSRSFNWGGSFPFAWRSAMKHYLLKAISNPVRHLDSWHVRIMMEKAEGLQLPYSLKPMGEYDLSQDVDIQRELPESISCCEGVFYNYFSIGMDAQVAYGFHHLRNKKPYLAQGPISNKLIYAGYSCTQGWFFTPCVKTPSLRGLKNILSLYIRKVNSKEWEKITVPSSVRSIVILNLDSYGSGSHPWGNPTPEYLEQRKFFEAHTDDGMLEIFGLKQGWHASVVMVKLISAKHIAQAAAIKLELRGGDWNKAYMQMDGEPWKQPINREHSTFIKIERVPFQSRMISGK
ncbi:diacylglycerol kinase 3 [Canna indica]|uniref:Diacylglycerol kinase n=1 Tax=Canna indica TaxID=4628 RepID=A0AAQ3KGV9_9LILI|nr:diacylglycerol kinase 3 [Canna indica]